MTSSQVIRKNQDSLFIIPVITDLSEKHKELCNRNNAISRAKYLEFEFSISVVFKIHQKCLMKA